MKTIIVITIILTIGFSIKVMLDVNRVYDYLEKKTEWCYKQGGVMIEVNCFSKDMHVIEVPLNVIL